MAHGVLFIACSQREGASVSRLYPQVRFRPSPELHEKIIRAAAHERRSINSEIVLILERHYEQTEKAPGNSLQATFPDASDSE
ncbi:Arc family DNA-binding protein [Acetobacter malorum]|uniref:Arc family DNA-binding protein n=1 Tax=Acetobacter malorum TaxID=178901 RepID=UPI0039EBA7BE